MSSSGKLNVNTHVNIYLKLHYTYKRIYINCSKRTSHENTVLATKNFENIRINNLYNLNIYMKW